MKIISTKLKGSFVIEPDIFTDKRGMFIKTFNKNTFKKLNIKSTFEENLFTVSRKNVIKGMHFQIPPKSQEKLFYVTKGSILDVILDIRKDSPTYGKYVSIEMSDKNHKIVFIPKGFAHGFLSKENNTCVAYLQTGMYSKKHDSGIRFDSFGMNWNTKKPIISKKDQNLKILKEFKTPFIYKK